MRTLLLIFARKRPKYADTGGGGKNGQILRTSFMDGPLYSLHIEKWGVRNFFENGMR